MSTATATRANTDVYAHHIADKVAADLKRLQRLYGIDSPTDKEIDAHQAEELIDKPAMAKMVSSSPSPPSFLYALTYSNDWISPEPRHSRHPSHHSLRL